MKITTNKAITYRPEVDGLRAVAVLPVIFFHAGIETFSGGYVGVDIFFVISGYLITSILLKELENGRFSVLKFYERRARRILPALFFVILCCLPMAWVLMLPDELRAFGQSLVAVATFLSNVYFFLSINYFNPSAEQLPLLHTWSLAVEEQFYLFFPLFLFAFWRFGKRKVFLLISLLFAVSLVMSEIGWRLNASANFYLLPTRAWELLTGSLLSFLSFKNMLKTSHSAVASFLAGIGLLLIAVSIYYFDSHTPFPSLYALVPVLGSALIIAFASEHCLTGRLLASPAFVTIGLISYSAYLWHQPLFAFARISDLDAHMPMTMPLLAVSSLFLAYLTWKYVETPFRNKKAIPPTLIYKLSGVGLVLVFSLGLFLNFGFKIKAHGTLYAEFLAQPGAIAANRGLRLAGCSEHNNGASDFTLCATKEKPGILLWGDSFAAHLAQLFESNDLGLAQATMPSCFPTSELTPFEDSLKYNRNWAKQCHEYSQKALDFAIQSDNIKIIVISSTFTWPLRFDAYDGESFRSSSIAEYTESFLHDIAKLRASGKKVVLVSPTPPGHNLDLLTCSKRLLLSQPSGTVLSPEATARCNFYSEVNDVDQFLARISEVAQVPIIDLRQFLCDSTNECSPFVAGHPVYYDWGHLSPYGSKRLEDIFSAGETILHAAQ